MAVRLDIRPRLRLSPDWQPGPATRRRFRLPPLAVPAAGYWVAMAALTYAFTQLGPHPLDEAYATEASVLRQEAPPPTVSPEPSVAPEPSAEPAPLATAPLALTEAEPPRESESPVTALPPAEPAPVSRHANAEPRARTEAPSKRDAEPLSAALTFPEFTDTAPAPARERVAAGPRVDSLFERSEAAPAPDAAEAGGTAERAPRPAVGLPSCEAAIARNEEHLDIGGPRGPADITREAYASILQDGRYLGGCSLPERTVLELCVAVKQGRAVGVTVTSAPANGELTACVRRAVSRLAFPHSERLDVTHTRFDAARR